MPSQVNITLTPGCGFAWQSAKWWEIPEVRAAILAKFWRRVNREKAKACWPYLGAIYSHGYGMFSIGRARIRAHRLAWLLSRGEIPAGQSVLHRCDNTRCVNPAHLFLGTQADNMHDAVRKGRKRAWGLQKLNAQQVREIRRCAAAGEPHKAIAARFSISRNHVSTLVHRKAWAHLEDVA